MDVTRSGYYGQDRVVPRRVVCEVATVSKHGPHVTDLSVELHGGRLNRRDVLNLAQQFLDFLNDFDATSHGGRGQDASFHFNTIGAR